MASESILVFRDEAGFVSYVKMLAARDPQALEQDFELLYIEREGEPLRPALAATKAALALRPADGIAFRVNATVDRSKRSLTIKTGRFIGRKKFRISSRHVGSNLALLGRLRRPRSESEDYERVAFWVEDEDLYQRLIVEHLELGVDSLEVAALDARSKGGSSAGGERHHVLLVSKPSFYLIQKWGEPQPHPGIEIFYEERRRGLFFEWGAEHPFASWLPADPRGQGLSFFRCDGGRSELEASDFRDIGLVIDFEIARESGQRWEARDDAARVTVPIRLVGRAAPADPELWILPVSRREELEFVLESTPEEELKNLLMAVFELPDGGDKVFMIREVLSGRVPHLLPETSRSYAHWNRQLPNLFVPCPQTLAPVLKPPRYADAFTLRPGELTLLDSVGEGQVRAVRVPEQSFRPLSQLVDFIFDGAADRIEDCLFKMPFELGEFAEVDLADPLAGRARTAPRMPREAPLRPATSKGDDDSLLGRMKNFLAGRRKDPEAAPQTDSGGEDSDEAFDEARWELEEAVVSRVGGVDEWFALGELFFEAGNLREGVRAIENGLWLADEDEEAPGHDRLRLAVGEPSGRLDSVEDLYGGILSLAADEAELNREELGQRTSWLWRQLGEASAALRKKSRWLLWRELLKVNGDPIEEARQREDLITELVLKGVEDREVPAFVRNHLLQSTRHEGVSSGGEKALTFLGEACDLVRRIDHENQRGVALATLGHAYVELGESERGLELARDAERALSSESDPALGAACRVRIAALRERAGRGGQAQVFRQILTDIAKEQAFNNRKALEKWFYALSLAGLDHRASTELLEAGLGAIRAYVSRYQALLLKEVVKPITKLGGGSQATALVRELLALPKSEYELESKEDDGNPAHEIVFYEDLVATLAALNENEPTDKADARMILDILDGMPEQINEFTIDMALHAYRCPDIDVLATGDAMAARYERDGHSFAALNIRVSVLRRLAELKSREEGRARLPELVEAVKTHRCGLRDCEAARDYHRLRLMRRLIELIPALGLSAEGSPLLADIAEFARQLSSEYVRTNLLSDCATAQARMGQRRDSMDMLERYFNLALQLVENGTRSGTVTDLLFWVLESCAEGVAVVGETQRGLELTRRIAELAESSLSPEWVPTQYWLYRAIIRAGHSALVLGSIEFAEATFEKALEQISEKVSFAFDRIELLQELASAVKELSSLKRFDLTRRILEVAMDSDRNIGEFGRDFLVRLVGVIADDIVQGESAYAMALKRWKGDEERLIRERVSSERITEHQH